MSSGGPMRQKDSLADVVEMLLDKGIVVNADIIVTIGETELLGIHLRAAIASFETAAEYGLEFPDGTDTERIEEVTGRRNHLETIQATGGEPDIVDENDETATWTVRPPVVVREDDDGKSSLTPDDESDEAASEATDAGESGSKSETETASTEEADGGD
ncbi:gas vesicle protein GvpA/GvpJ/GvpM family [Halohasta litchfieldiae]|uniref:Gas vesicle protein n=1 Tax=Halohasta litchfieldiae TaxID=1073996 RepID=A0A1H6T6Q6_9EURY|nr:gas vesicle protein GvpA/GvpJ/GvpM family [Halohasta litchfieldiae]SEI75701.1 Gas vesicle protein [Halohasta litchfieldiae]